MSPTNTDQISDDAGSILPMLDYESKDSIDLASDDSTTPVVVYMAGRVTKDNATNADAQSQAPHEQAQREQAQHNQTHREKARHDQEALESLAALRGQASQTNDPLEVPISPVNAAN